MVASAGSRSARVPALAKYEVLEELGHGGMATVYRAHDKRLSRDVAVKVLHPHLRESREIAHRFEAEAKAVAKLRHANIVEVFDVSSAEEEEQYLVVELIRGDTLRRLLQKGGALPPEIAAALAIELLGALAHAHASGVVHRDVKPENVLLEHRRKDQPTRDDPSAPTSKDRERSGETPPVSTPSLAPSSGGRKTPPRGANRGERVAVKLTDFGIAKLLDAQGVTSTGQVLGSPAHMAPEQIEGGEVDGRADIFGLGVLLYECMVGHLPFEGNNPAQVLRRVLDGLYPSAERERPLVGKIYSQILDTALARKPEDRFPDAPAMRDALVNELARVGIKAPRAELEAYFDDPTAWTEEHDKRLIGKLCDLGSESRKRGDAVAAAADYNRALAYAPEDQQLLRIVTSMHRAEARMRMIKRTAPLLLGVVALGAGAFFVARAVKGAGDGPSPIRPVDTGAVASAEPSTTAAPPRVPASVPSAVVSAPKIATSIVTTRLDAGSAVSAPGKKRSVVIASLRPANGVFVSIDGSGPRETGPDSTFNLDEKEHSLVFTCSMDLCDPQSITVPADDKEHRFDVVLHIHPGKVIVEGDATHSYGIDELPTLTVVPGVAATIPMTNEGRRMITVFDRSDPTKKQTVVVSAGQQKTVSFR
ncbi:MAG: serine/threonine protein kinase [Deltaproteobacteria bacterium]|nr:serine/threonine protein kinase [Deltaproteobacteria bacterium]